MAVEAKRGCGYRKAGGLYLVSKDLGVPCDRLPAALVPCGTCGTAIKQVRSWQWANVQHALAGAKPCAQAAPGCGTCPVCSPNATNVPGGKVGLLWVGVQHYPTPADWAKEAAAQGVSKRIAAIPAGLKLGATWVFVAHPRAFSAPCQGCAGKGDVPAPAQGNGHAVPETVDCPTCAGEGNLYTPGITHAFKPSAVELVATPSMAKAKWARKLVKEQGVVVVEVPEGDPDHAPTVRKAAGGKDDGGEEE